MTFQTRSLPVWFYFAFTFLLLAGSALAQPWGFFRDRAPERWEEMRPERWEEPRSQGGPKRVVISKRDQQLRGYEGGELVYQSRVSTGRKGKETPSGSFRVQSKKRMHYSSRYENAPMPYAVQYSGHYFIHGYSSVPRYPASNGCVRLPIGSAEDFYHWVDVGTPVRVR